MLNWRRPMMFSVCFQYVLSFFSGRVGSVPNGSPLYISISIESSRAELNWAEFLCVRHAMTWGNSAADRPVRDDRSLQLSAIFSCDLLANCSAQQSFGFVPSTSTLRLVERVFGFGFGCVYVCGCDYCCLVACRTVTWPVEIRSLGRTVLARASELQLLNKLTHLHRERERETHSSRRVVQSSESVVQKKKKNWRRS